MCAEREQLSFFKYLPRGAYDKSTLKPRAVARDEGGAFRRAGDQQIGRFSVFGGYPLEVHNHEAIVCRARQCVAGREERREGEKLLLRKKVRTERVAAKETDGNLKSRAAAPEKHGLYRR